MTESRKFLKLESNSLHIYPYINFPYFDSENKSSAISFRTIFFKMSSLKILTDNLLISFNSHDHYAKYPLSE